MLNSLPAYLIASIIPLVALVVIYKLDFYKTGQYRTIFFSFLAGFLAFWLAAQANKLTISQGWLKQLEVVRYSAPIVEEILKGLLLWYLVRRPNFTYFVEGAVYGFAAGIGFAVIENFDYINHARDSGLMLAISRVISTNLMHATTTSLLGVMLGRARFENKLWRQLGLSLVGLLLGMAMHMGYNNLVTRVNSGLLLVYAGACGFIGTGLIAYIIRNGLKTGKAWIEESLDMTDRVTKGEAAAVVRMDSIDQILKPIEERFGKKKAEQSKDFMIIQARIGLLRKSLSKLSDERMKRSIEDELAKLRVDMDKARKQVGSYAMLYLRQTFPEGDSPLWGRLETIIQERAAAPKPAGGMNLWANLQNRQADQKKTTPETKQENKE